MAALQDAVEYIRQHPQEAAAWFAQQLRQDPAAVEKLAAENPVFASGSQISVVPSAEFKAFASERAGELAEFGLTKVKVDFLFR